MPTVSRAKIASKGCIMYYKIELCK